jgi:hypothetical protein
MSASLGVSQPWQHPRSVVGRQVFAGDAEGERRQDYRHGDPEENQHCLVKIAGHIIFTRNRDRVNNSQNSENDGCSDEYFCCDLLHRHSLAAAVQMNL